MISPTGGLRVFVATRPTDFRKGIDGLARLVQETMGLDPFSGAAFVFRDEPLCAIGSRTMANAGRPDQGPGLGVRAGPRDARQTVRGTV